MIIIDPEVLKPARYNDDCDPYWRGIKDDIIPNVSEEVISDLIEYLEMPSRVSYHVMYNVFGEVEDTLDELHES